MFTLYCHSTLSEISFRGRVRFDNLQFDLCPMKTWFLPDNYEIIFVEEIQCFLIEGQDRRACSEENVLFKFYFPGHSCIESVQSNKF